MDNETNNPNENGKIACSDVEQLFDSYQESSLEDDVLGRVEAHLESCSGCRELYTDLSDIVGTAKSLADRPIPAGVSKRLHARLEKELPCKFTDSKPRLYLVKS